MTIIPRRYVCAKAKEAPHIDGNIHKSFWENAPWTDDFIDIQGPALPTPRYRTRAKMLWCEEGLCIAAEMEEPHVWGTLTEHDSVIFHDNDFEVFIDPDGDHHLYSELELNVLNTTWDLLLVKPYRDGGPPINSWELKGLQTAVKVQGALNDPTQPSQSWTTEIMIPWTSLQEISRQPSPPKSGDIWRINFSRVEWHHEVVDGKYQKIPNRPEDNWVWSPQGVIDMHRPDMWGYLEFSDLCEAGPFVGNPPTAIEAELMRVYFAQHAFRNQHQRFATSATDLALDTPATILGYRDGFTATLSGYSIREDCLFTKA